MENSAFELGMKSIWTYCDRTVIVLWSYCYHTVIVLWSYGLLANYDCTVIILWLYCDCTLFVLSSYFHRTVFVLSSCTFFGKRPIKIFNFFFKNLKHKLKEKSSVTPYLQILSRLGKKCRRSRLFSDCIWGKVAFWDMAILVVFWGFLGIKWPM